MQYEDSARYIYSLAKRARKYFLGLTTITQDVEDVLNSQQGRAVLNNSSLQILLKQSPTAVEKLSEVFKLTEGEKFLLLESNVGEGLFFAGTNHVAIQVVASYAEDQIITSDPTQILASREAEEAKNAPTQVITPDQTATPAPASMQASTPPGTATAPQPENVAQAPANTANTPPSAPPSSPNPPAGTIPPVA